MKVEEHAAKAKYTFSEIYEYIVHKFEQSQMSSQLLPKEEDETISAQGRFYPNCEIAPFFSLLKLFVHVTCWRHMMIW